MRHPLYDAAEAADQHLSAVCAALGRTRWTLTAQDYTQTVREAIKAKYAADEAWLEVIRKDSEARLAQMR